MLHDYANGIDNSKICSEAISPKSIGNSKTIEKDLTDIDEIASEILILCDKTASRLRAENMKCKTVTITLKTNYFKTYSSSYTMQNHTDITRELFDICKNILHNMYSKEPIRLVGVTLSHLQNIDSTQLSLFDTEKEKYSKVDKTVDKIITIFGDSSVITRASALTKNSPHKH